MTAKGGQISHTFCSIEVWRKVLSFRPFLLPVPVCCRARFKNHGKKEKFPLRMGSPSRAGPTSPGREVPSRREGSPQNLRVSTTRTTPPLKPLEPLGRGDLRIEFGHLHIDFGHLHIDCRSRREKWGGGGGGRAAVPPRHPFRARPSRVPGGPPSPTDERPVTFADTRSSSIMLEVQLRNKNEIW